MTPYDTLLHSASGEIIHSSDMIALQFKTTVWQVHTLLIPICCSNLATLIPYTIWYLLQSYSTLPFLEIYPPLWGVHTFHQSAEIWFYLLYTIISKNPPFLSDSIRSIDQLFRLHQTFPCYQTLQYYYRKYPIPCANPYIPLISCNLILYIIHYHFENLPLFSDSIQSINQLFHLHQTCSHDQTLHYFFQKYPSPLCKSIHSIDQLQSDSIDLTPSFRNISPCWVIPYNLFISCFI